MRNLILPNTGWAMVLSLAFLASAAPARADGTACPLTKATKELAGCSCCQQYKALLDRAEGTEVSLEVFEMQHGLVVRLRGTDAEAVDAIHAVVDALWSIGAADADGFCPDCTVRHDMLQQAGRDRALTEDGAIVVLSSDDPQTLQWLRKDANQARELVQSASLR